jgi:hypothetical protein
MRELFVPPYAGTIEELLQDIQEITLKIRDATSTDYKEYWVRQYEIRMLILREYLRKMRT